MIENAKKLSNNSVKNGRIYISCMIFVVLVIFFIKVVYLILTSQWIDTTNFEGKPPLVGESSGRNQSDCMTNSKLNQTILKEFISLLETAKRTKN